MSIVLRKLRADGTAMKPVIVIRLLALAGVVLDTDHEEEPLPSEGALLASFDPEAFEGNGLATWTLSTERAMTFGTPFEALVFLRQTPESKPFREDGHPNRPLCVYTVEIGQLI